MNAQVVSSGAAEKQVSSSSCRQAAKWAAVVDDVVILMPQRTVPLSVLLQQSAIPDGFVLVRDHNSPNDFLPPDGSVVDLGAGNVFYRLNKCEVQAREACHAPPKLAFIVDDRAEITLRPDQTGQSLRDLFSLGQHAKVYRDVEGPQDQEIANDAAVIFQHGPVFYSRRVEAKLSISVNSRVFTDQDGVKPEMTGLEIAALVYPENPENTSVWFVSDGNREVDLAATIKIRGCEVLEVVRKEVTGGFELSRVAREVGGVRMGGVEVTVLEAPIGVVVYHGLRTRPGAPIAAADVLVPIPSGYPGQMIDWAYLPENSPLIGRVKGSPQDHRITALDQVWRQISYHPHNGGGAPKWNPTIHGFHTYLGELLSWLHDMK